MAALTEGGGHVSRIPDRLFLPQALPEIVIADNGPEFTGMALGLRATQHGVYVHFIQSGKLGQNACIESFTATFRDARLNDHWCLAPPEVQPVLEAWRREYPEERPPGAIGSPTPMEFIHRHHNQRKLAQESTWLAVV